MKKLGKIHFRTIEEGLSESEMKFVVGGSGYGGDSGTGNCYTLAPCDMANDCMGKVCGEACIQSSSGRTGKCIPWLCHTNFLGIPWEYGTTCAVGLSGSWPGY